MLDVMGLADAPSPRPGPVAPDGTGVEAVMPPEVLAAAAEKARMELARMRTDHAGIPTSLRRRH